MSFDIERIRAEFPALRADPEGSEPYAYLDGAAGTQVPRSVAEATLEAYRRGIGNVHGAFPASRRSDAIVEEARQAVADLTGGRPNGVVFGPSMTTLTYRIAGALADTWEPGDEIVVSRLDHDANVRPWVQAARRRGVTVRWAEFDPDTGELPVEQYDALVTEQTRLVAVTAASNVLGTRPDLETLTRKAKRVGALSYVDGVHATPHGPVDVARLGADFYVTSAYKWCGPHLAALVADPALLSLLPIDKLAPAPDTVPERLEQGTLPFADLAAVTAAVDHLAGLDTDAEGSRRDRVLASMRAAEAHTARLFADLLDGLRAAPDVTVYGAAERRTPTAWFRVAGRTPREVAEHFADHRVNVWSGTNYAWEPAGMLGIRDDGGAVRAGLVHYNDASDVTRFLAALEKIA